MNDKNSNFYPDDSFEQPVSPYQDPELLARAGDDSSYLDRLVAESLARRRLENLAAAPDSADDEWRSARERLEQAKLEVTDYEYRHRIIMPPDEDIEQL